MRILLVAATPLEIGSFLKHPGNVEVLICGVGIPETIYTLTKKLLQHSYDLVIQAGIAGAFLKKLKKGQVVLVKQDIFGDIGVEENSEFITVFGMGLADENSFPFSGGWLLNDHALLRASHLPAVNAVTVNKLSDRKKQKQQLIKNFDADVESMEGAAFHYVCLQMNVPFLQVRSISNRVGERDKSKWKLGEAIENLDIELGKLINTLSAI